MCQLKNIIPENATIMGNSSIKVSSVVFDSRKIIQDCTFVAVKGTAVDGHKYINQAIESGATSIVCEELPTSQNKDICYITVEDSMTALSYMAAAYYEFPSKEITIIGVTGTNGKTTVATILYELFTDAGFQCGLLSTVVNYVGNEKIVATHTTPDAVAINKLIRKMVDAGCNYCFMEVSSHAIDQKRVAHIDFDGGIFTNLTQDHLDYHNTFAEYRDVKKALFDNLKKDAFALINLDDKNGMIMLQNCKAKKLTYSLQRPADYSAKIIEQHFNGSCFRINGVDVWSHLTGKFNIYNLLSIYATAVNIGLSNDEVLRLISKVKPVEGRFQTILSGTDISAIVDYAHTPDAIKNVLQTIKSIDKEIQIITVIGAGGDRDKGKRPLMGNIATELSNKVILTSDNPRSENPDDIIKDMKEGVSPENYYKMLSITDRREAIKTAVMLAQQGSVIVVAGKGHETYQDIKGVKSHFDDREEVQEAFKTLIQK